MPTPAPHARAHFADRLADAIDRAGAPACVGIDPVLERIPEPVRSGPGDDTEAVRAFCLGVLDAVAGVVAAVKPQSACFERFGSMGVGVLEDVIAHARGLGLLVVLDVKRGDIGSTAQHYAAAAVGMGADAVTVNAYMGPSTVTPFLDAGLGVYALVRTSNADSDRVQSIRVADGRTVADHVASLVAELGSGRLGERGLSQLGAVVGATKSGAEGAALRALLPDAPMLVPGVGAQGGSIGEVRPLARPGAVSPGETGLLINASRSVLYPEPGSGEDWAEAVRRAAQRFACEAASLNPLRPG